jgi:hypothetical protein
MQDKERTLACRKSLKVKYSNVSQEHLSGFGPPGQHVTETTLQLDCKSNLE